MPEKSKIIGRYAPSPTGELHFGNLRTAMLAWLHARLQGGDFIVRMEDLDTPRVVPGSADQILRDLEWLGLDWDGPVLYQSQRSDLYQYALNKLSKSGLSYQCFCSRKDILEAASAPHGNVGVYSGFCRGLSTQDIVRRKLIKAPATRVKVPQQMSSSIGDFVVKRADGIFAYQLATTVDDLDQGVTEVQRMSKRDGSISVKNWKQTSNKPEELLGFLAFTSGILKKSKSINKKDLIDFANDKNILSELSLFF